MTTATIDSMPKPNVSRLNQCHGWIFLTVWFVLNPIALLGGSTTLFDGLKLRLYTICGPFIMMLDGSWTESVGNRTTATACVVIPIAVLAFGLQIVWRPSAKLANSLGYVLWIAGWQAWFLGAAYMLGTSFP